MFWVANIHYYFLQCLIYSTGSLHFIAITSKSFVAPLNSDSEDTGAIEVTEFFTIIRKRHCSYST